jgi:hypothetical protein
MANKVNDLKLRFSDQKDTIETLVNFQNTVGGMDRDCKSNDAKVSMKSIYETLNAAYSKILAQADDVVSPKPLPGK